MVYLEQIAFFLVLVATIFMLRKRVLRIRNAIRMGKEVDLDQKGKRWKNVLLVALGQKKMFKKPLPALFHIFIYAGFLIINIEVLEFIMDGLLGTHRAFAPFLGSFYPILMNVFEFLAVMVLLSCVVFLVRRNVLKIPRFWTAEMSGWPRRDGNLILIIEIALMGAILTMNASDQVLQLRDDHYTDTGELIFSSLITPVIQHFDTSSLIQIERVAWWFHIVGILGFAIYVTYSKHLHIFMAFPTVFFARLTANGKITNMPVVTHEVKAMLGLAEGVNTDEPGRFGAKDINDLPRSSLVAAYACTECGRCTSECPANLTGKKLSPRKIMMDTRDRLEEVGKTLAKGGEGINDGKTLLGDYISKEEINACTSCNACVEACPVLINPLDIILDLRRYVAMEESGSPQQWNAMFQNVETNFAPWKFPANDRFNWADSENSK